MSTESFVTVPPDSDGKRLRALNYTLSGQNAAQSVWSEVINIGDPQSGAYLALVNASGALSVSTSGDAVSVSGNIVGVYAASQQSGWMAVVSGVQATSGALTVASSGLATVAISSGGVVPVMAASFQSGWAAVVSGVGATSGQLNVASSGIGAVAIASGGIIPISIISGNVVALSGIVEIVSGQTVTVVSSGIGTIAVSSGGVIPTMLASAQSGGLVGISGGGLTISGGVTVSGGLTISGGVTISGNVMISGVGNTSGQLNIASSGLGTVAISSGGTLPVGLTGYQSGVLVGISGGSVGLSGLQGVAISGSVTVLPNAYQSGQLVALSGGGAGISGVAVSVSGNVMLVAVSGQILLQGESTTNPNLRVGLFGAANQVSVFAGLQGDNVTGSFNGLDIQSFSWLFNGANWDRIRSIAGASGVIGAIGIPAVLPAPWTYKNISGAIISNIWQSGAVFVHAVNINTYSSGLAFRIRDSQSGAAGTIVGTVSPDAGSITNVGLPPTTLLYDAVFVTGLVVETSGTNWDLTVFYRGLLS